MIAMLGLPGCCAFSAPAHRGLPSEHFDGARFHNQEPLTLPSLGDLLRWRRTRRPGPWDEWTEARPGPPPPRRVGPGSVRVTFVNHATMLIQLDRVNILTDPVWSDRVGPVSWAGPRRRRPPGIRFEDLPPIHVVLLSHNHYDHMDIPTLRRLQRAHAPRVVVGLGNRAVLRPHGIRDVVELDWWQSVEVAPGVGVTLVPSQHFSSRGLCDRMGTLWGGFVVRSTGGSVYFAGDTGMGPHFQQIRRRLGPMRVALLPIGAFRPRWFMKTMHIAPDEAVQVHRTLQARVSVAMHFGTFRLGDDGQHEPVQALRRALARADMPPDEFVVLGFGEGREL